MQSCESLHAALTTYSDNQNIISAMLCASGGAAIQRPAAATEVCHKLVESIPYRPKLAASRSGKAA